MAIILKTKEEIRKMKDGGKILHEILSELESSLKIGMNTLEIDIQAEALCKKNKVKPAFKGYSGYSWTVCAGRNEIAVHGIPSIDQIILDGDILSIDMGIIYKGFYLDSAITIPVGNVDQQGLKLIEVTKLARKKAIEVAIPGNTIGDIGHVIENIAKLSGFNVITQMTGHGIGRKLHEDPQIPCFGEKGSGTKIREGMVIAIEPMINEGSSELVFAEDGWTTRTADGKRSAIFEHTVAITDNSNIILTN